MQIRLPLLSYDGVKLLLFVWRGYTHPFNGPFSGTTRVSQYQKGKTNLVFAEWQWHQLGHMQVCISLQTDNHASTPPLSFFCRPTNSVKALKANLSDVDSLCNICVKCTWLIVAHLMCVGRWVCRRNTRKESCSAHMLHWCHRSPKVDHIFWLNIDVFAVSFLPLALRGILE